MAHAHFMLYTSGYKHTLIICNANCFFIAKMITPICLNITLYLYCQSCQSCVFTAVFPILRSTKNCGLFGSFDDNKNFSARLHDQLCHLLICSSFHGHCESPNSQRIHSKVVKEAAARKYRGREESVHRPTSHYIDFKATKKKKTCMCLINTCGKLCLINTCGKLCLINTCGKLSV
jgi:hypothetical protein